MGEATGQEMTKIEKEINKLRILKRVTDNLGTYYENNNNEIVCHINNWKLKKHLNTNNNDLILKGFTEEDKLSLQALYGIGKTIKYVINDFNFDDITLNTAGDTFIEFNCCKFNGELQFENVNKVIFNECSLLALYNIYIGNKVEEPIDYVSFYRCIFIDTMGRKTKSYDGFEIEANEIDIKECALSAGYIEMNSLKANIFSSFLSSDLDLNLITKYLNIIKASISSGTDLSINSDNISTEHALFEAPNIKIQNSELDFNGFSNINIKNTYGFNYNGVTLKRPLYKYLKNITPEFFVLLRQRAILANTLYRVYNKCESDIKVKTNAYTRKLVNKSISDTLGE